VGLKSEMMLKDPLPLVKPGLLLVVTVLLETRISGSRVIDSRVSAGDVEHIVLSNAIDRGACILPVVSKPTHV
jgi:hypothetical protein